MEHSPVRGFRDLLPLESEQMTALESLARQVLSRYGYQEIRLPSLELKELFVKATGETTDIVEKEMFSLQDQGGRTLALRPEGTPGVVRAFLHHHLNQQGSVVKLFYIGNMFRAERPQAGRYREFEQIGVECLGNPHPAADIEAILALRALLEQCGLSGKIRFKLNNLGCEEKPGCRPHFRSELLSLLKSKRSELCVNCQNRIERNPLRALDCKTDGPKLASIAPRLKPCSDCENHVETVSRFLKENGLPHEYPDSSLVRGLDYYTRTVFEFCASGIGSQDALAGGGRYDGLVAAMGGPSTPAVGWALGVERTLLALAGIQDQKPAAMNLTQIFVAVQSPDPKAANLASKILESLRQAGFRAEGLFASSLKTQMREANRQKAQLAVIIGEAELKKNPASCMLKDLRHGEQQEIPTSELVKVIQDKLGHA